MAGQPLPLGAMGKAWVVAGKCHLFQCVGRRDTQVILRPAIGADLSVVLGRADPVAAVDNVSHTLGHG